MSFGKSSPVDLWSKGPSTAELQTNRGDVGAYVQAYFEAASHLADEMSANKVGVDIVVYPTLYLLRHGLELGFKALLRGFEYELRETIKLDSGSPHSLARLWKALRPLLVKCSWRSYFELGGASPALTLEDIDQLVIVLHEADPGGDAARYDTTLKGQPTLPGIVRVNLGVLKEICSSTGGWLCVLVDARETVVSSVRVQRWERGEE